MEMRNSGDRRANAWEMFMRHRLKELICDFKDKDRRELILPGRTYPVPATEEELESLSLAD